MTVQGLVTLNMVEDDFQGRCSVSAWVTYYEACGKIAGKWCVTDGIPSAQKPRRVPLSRPSW